MERSPIHLDDDDEDGQPGALSRALVPLESGSPSKRSKTGPEQPALIDERHLLSKIQTTIQESAASSLGSMHVTVQTLVDATAAQNKRLQKVEQAVASHHDLLENLDLEHSHRMDTMQGELVELQKAMASPKTAPPPPSLAVAGQGAETLDIVLGGWKEGSRREWVESQLSELLDHVGVKACVSHLRVVGKRPTFAKLELKFEEGKSLREKRDFQLNILQRLRRADRAPGGCKLWITTDKTPAQRKVSKAIALLNQFLSDRLHLERGVLDVSSSWVAAKSFVGDERVTGLSEEHQYGTKPTCAVEDFRWLVRDEATGVNVWLDMDRLATGLGVNKPELLRLWGLQFPSPRS